MSESIEITRKRVHSAAAEEVPPPPAPGENVAWAATAVPSGRYGSARTTRARLRSLTERLRRPSPALPGWSVLVLAVLAAGPALAFELVFGNGQGLLAAGAGAAAGLAIGTAASRWHWDLLSVLAAVAAVYLLLGGYAALPQTLANGFVPTGQTLQVLVLGVWRSWKDLLTLTPPISAYSGPAVVPWITGLLAGTLSSLITIRLGRPVAGTLPMGIMGFVAIFFGPSGQEQPAWAVAAWWVVLVGWWAWAAQRQRLRLGQDVLAGRADSAPAPAGGAAGGRMRSTVYAGRRVAGALTIVAAGVAVAVPVTIALSPLPGRVVGRDLVDPPLDVRTYPSPLSAFRHYSTDLKDDALITVSELPDGQRVRIAAMDVYDGTTFGMSVAGESASEGYIPVGTAIPGRAGTATASISVTTDKLRGPWVPVLGRPENIVFTDGAAGAQREGLHFDQWANTALTTSPSPQMAYTVETSFADAATDDELEGLPAASFTNSDKNLPQGLESLALEATQNADGPLATARAIEHYLSGNGFYLQENTVQSRPGVRTDRLERMLKAPDLIGDDEQYAALMALILHSKGINARVVMGAYPAEGADGHNRRGTVKLFGADLHVWVEVEFKDGMWGVFDPTPPRDKTPQTQVPKPKTVPRPQVLQPPDPPKPPVELPPNVRDQNADTDKPDSASLPWGLILGGTGLFLLLFGPVIGVVVYKALRRRRRRRAEPAAALLGSWDEVVDLAADAGIWVEAGQTRQEAAWSLSRQWSGDQDIVEPNAFDLVAAPSGANAAVIAGWTPFEQEVPTAVAIARRADIANFAHNGATREHVNAAWKDFASLRAQVRRTTGPIQRARRALSLRSVRRNAAQARRRRKEQG